MGSYDSDKDRSPLFMAGNLPVTAAVLIVGVLALAMVLWSVLTAFGVELKFLAFESAAVMRGEVWRVVTYPFYNPPSIFAVVDLFFLFWFGRELEKFFGRRAFLRFYGLLILVQALATMIVSWGSIFGPRFANFAVFIAFAVLYPRAQIFFGIEARWLAVIYLAINVLQALAYHAWDWFAPLFACSALAFAFVRFEQGRWSFKLPERRPKLRVIEGGAKPEQPANVDAILEKISREGMQSLTAKEREQLEQARQHLLKK